MHITRLEVSGFKSLRDVSVPLHPLSLLVGANGSGKSNLLEVLRILQGLSLGLTVQETLDGVSRPGRAWDGIRGGLVSSSTDLLEADDANELQVSIRFASAPRNKSWDTGFFECEIENGGGNSTFLSRETAGIGVDGSSVRLSRELEVSQDDKNSESWEFAVDGEVRAEGSRGMSNGVELAGSALLGEGIKVWDEFAVEDPSFFAVKDPGVSTRDGEKASLFRDVSSVISEKLASFMRDFRLFRLLPENMRKPWGTGFTELDEQGQGLGPVVRKIISDEDDKRRMLEWLSELLPLQVVDIDVTEPSPDKYLVEVVEAIDEGEGEVKRSAEVLSDGTLHFLGLLAALFGAGRGRNGGDESRLMALEDIEENLHPSRLQTLVELLDRMTTRDDADRTDLQVLATTHAPQVLDWFEPEDLERVVYFWRDPETLETKTKPVSEFEHLDRILEQGISLGELHSEDWFEGEVQ